MESNLNLNHSNNKNKIPVELHSNKKLFKEKKLSTLLSTF